MDNKKVIIEIMRISTFLTSHTATVTTNVTSSVKAASKHEYATAKYYHRSYVGILRYSFTLFVQEHTLA